MPAIQHNKDLLDRVARLYREGRYLDAYAAGEPLGELTEWEGTAARVLAGRLANVLGAPKLGRVLHRLAYRADPEDAEARFFYLVAIFVRRGPYTTWTRMRTMQEPADAGERVRADWHALRAHMLAVLRDFESAERHIRRAVELAPQHPWVWVEQAAVLDAEDRPEEALESARRALAIRPWFRAGVQSTAHFLVQLNRDEEAVELLSAAAEKLQSGDVVAQLAALQTELGRYAEARANFDRLEEYFPLAHRDKDRREHLLARRADAAYYCGDFEEAARLAAEVKQPFFEEIARRLSQRPLEGGRVVLPVGFVRQHHVTCAPATLSAISGFWSKPADHLEVAEKICYDGTPAASERRWAEENGFVAREFRITWESAAALLDRGIPFTLNTVGPGAAHLQAVIGYDSRRGTLVIRDPSERHFGEFLADKMLEHFSATGPRGMAMAPRERAGLLEGIELPETDLYDACYQIELALQRHDREEARRIHNRMRQSDPDHRLTIRARLSMANYDADPANLLKCAQRLLKQFPDDANMVVGKLNCLRDLGRREDRLSLLEEVCRKPESDPLFWYEYARELSEDARQYGEVIYWIHRALRHRPMEGGYYQLLADVYWERHRREESLELYRFAACLQDRDEARARAYFVACRHFRQTETAVEMLEDRFRRFGKQSSWPARTLCLAYEQLEQTNNALAVVDEALRLREDDGDLLLFGADMYGRYGKNHEADALLERARANSHHTAWLRAAAYLALYRGDLAEALEFWRRVLEAEPLARDANDIVAQLLADLEGVPAALDHLRNAVKRFPHSHPLRVFLVDWLRREDVAAAEAAVRELLELHPADPWAQRELAIALVQQGKWEEAAEEAELACRLEPTSPVGHMIRGRVLQATGDLEGARRAYRHSLRQSIDYDPAIGALMGTCDTKAEREAELEFLSGELARQVIFGDGLLTFRDYAAETMQPDKLLAQLREALEVRPDLWHAHAALIRQLTSMDRLDEANELAEQAVDRFSLLPRMWLELAVVCRARGDRPREIEALEHALHINPSWGEAARQLAEAYQASGDLQKAKALLERAIVREPRDALNHGFLADVLWQLGERDAAVERLNHAVRIEPGYEWAWSRLKEWSTELERPELTADLARRLTQARPNEVRSWLVLANILRGTSQDDECLAAVDKALAINARNVEAHGLRVDCLREAGRLAEARAACRPEAFGDQPPLQLRAREAEILWMEEDRDAALGQMQAVVQADPDYAWAWSRLADWHETLEQNEPYLQASEHLVRLTPEVAASWGFRADARRRTGDRDGAKRDFQRSLEIAPEYTFGAASLFDMQLEDGELKEAAETLRVGAPHMPPPYALAFGIRLAVARGTRRTALDDFARLCRTPQEDPGAVGMAVDALTHSPWAGEFLDVFDGLVDRPETDPHVGAVFTGVFARAFGWRKCCRRIGRLEGRGELWHLAVLELLDGLPKAGQRALLRRFVKRHRDVLREDTQTWAAVGNALADVDREVEAAAWLSDWQHRSGVEPQMLFPLVLGLWRSRRRAEAVAVGRHALGLPPDGSAPYHALWLAVNDLADGDLAATADRLAPIAAESLTDYYRGLHALVQAVVETRPSASEQPLSYAAAWRRLEQAWLRVPGGLHSDVLLRRIHRLCHWQLAHSHNRRLAAAWQRLLLAIS